MEGWRSVFFIDAPLPQLWNAEQIRLHVMLTWILSALWFIAGLCVPAWRWP